MQNACERLLLLNMVHTSKFAPVTRVTADNPTNHTWLEGSLTLYLKYGIMARG